MCHQFFGPPYGIPIPPEIHEQYAQNVKDAWVTFDAWWKKARASADDKPIKIDSMPADVRAAYDLINSTLIPGRDDGATGADSCYMIGVKAQMT